MGAHDDVGLDRSPSIDSRDILSRSDSQRKSQTRLRGQRSNNDLFVCFAPPRNSLSLVSSRPVLSPSREKSKEPAGRRSRVLSSSVFSKSAKKPGFEGEEEPTSPKVTCIGQVRVKHKEAKSIRSAKQGKQPRIKDNTGSESPARSSASSSARGSISGYKKEHCSSACSSFGKDFLCFGFPCDPYGSLPSFREDKKSSGTVFAKSLVLIQANEGKCDSKINSEKQMELQNSCSSEHMDVLKSIHLPRELREDLTSSAQITAEEQVEAEGQITESMAAAATISNTGLEQPLKEQEEPLSETQGEEEDTFDPEPPPSNALLLMRHKVENGEEIVPPSPKFKLKRSTSAPAQCRVRSSSNKGDDRRPEPGGKEKKNRHFFDKSSKESSPIGEFIQKSFLKRCKSVSESFTQSNGLKVRAFRQHIIAVKDREKLEAMPPEVKQIEKISQDTNSIGVPKMEDEQIVPDLVNSGSGKRSEWEALKVSLDIVPETWLWQSCTVVRPPKGNEREKRTNKHGMKRLDAELEASLWRHCKVAEPRKDTDSTSQETGVERIDAEVENSALQSCQKDGKPEASKGYMNVKVATNTMEGESNGRPSLGRSSSIGSKVGQEGGYIITQLEEVGSKENPARDTDLIRQMEHMGDSDLNEREIAKQVFMQCDSSYILEHANEPARELPIRTNNQECAERMANIDELEQDKLLQEFDKSGDSREAEENASPSPILVVNSSSSPSPLTQFTSPSQCSAPNQAQAQAQASIQAQIQEATDSTLLVLRYNLNAFRISLDAPEYSIFTDSKKFTESRDHHQHQQKAMLKAVSHFHEVGRCARLLKAASGRERDPLASAIRLQRCKSEPVRLTS